MYVIFITCNIRKWQMWLKSMLTYESYLYRRGIHADLSPRDSFIWPGAGIRSVKLLPSVDKHRKICSVPLRAMKKKNDEIFYSEEVSIIVLFLGSYDYHEISVGDMMFDETSSENNHSCALGKHGLAVQPPNIWSIQNCHNEMTNGFCEIISRLTHPPQCQALVQGSYMSGSRSYHPMSRQWGRD